MVTIIKLVKLAPKIIQAMKKYSKNQITYNIFERKNVDTPILYPPVKMPY